MKRRFRSSLTGKITICLLICAIVPLASVALSSHRSSVASSVAEAENHTAALVGQQRGNIERLFVELEALIDTALDQPAVQAMLTPPIDDGAERRGRRSSLPPPRELDPATGPALEAALAKALDRYRHLSGVISLDLYYFSAAGRTQYRAGETLSGKNVRQEVIDRLFTAAQQSAPKAVWRGLHANANVNSEFSRVVTAAKLVKGQARGPATSTALIVVSGDSARL